MNILKVCNTCRWNTKLPFQNKQFFDKKVFKIKFKHKTYYI